jgi:predicted Zn-dependent peptidase
MIERNESFKEKMLKKSRGLVEERRRMLEDSMDGVIYERLGSPGKLKGDLQSYQESSN